MRVACCSVARQMLRALGIEVGSHVIRLGEVGMDDPADWVEDRDALLAEGGARALYEKADQSEVRMLSDELSPVPGRESALKLRPYATWDVSAPSLSEPSW